MSPGARERLERALLPAFAALVALGVHLPALRAPAGSIPGEAGSDALRAAWSVWMVSRDLPWPFETALVNFPAGVDVLPFPAVSLLLSAPLTWIIGPIPAMTLLVVLFTAFAVVASGALVRALGGGRGGELLAGALVASQPILGGALRDGTLEVLAVGWVPLTWWAMVLACRGSLRHGLLAALFFLCTCLESVYYGSFAAIGVVFSLVTLRDRQGIRAAALAALGVALGVAVLGFAFRPVLDGVREALATANQSIGELQVANAAKLGGLIEMGRHPGVRGWNVGDLYAPPVAHWAVFAAGALLGLRRAPWLPVLGGIFLLLALNHPALGFWIEGPLGEVVRFPRRYMAVVAVAFGCAAGVGLRELLRWPRLELGLGFAGAAALAVIGARAAGLGANYPTVSLPAPAFSAAIAEDDEDCALLLLPLEVPGKGGSVRTEQPVFAGLTSNIASADLLILSLRADKAGWYTPSLATLAKNDGPTGLLPRTFTNLARPKYGATLAKSAVLPNAAYDPELAWLEGEGLKYVAVDLGAYREQELTHIDEVLRAAAVAVDDYPDGNGVRVYRLYDERPPRVEAPAMSGADEIYAGFMGVITNGSQVLGRLRVKVMTSGNLVECPVHPGDNRFECNVGKTVDEVHVFVEERELPSQWSGGLLDAKITVEIPPEFAVPKPPEDRDPGPQPGDPPREGVPEGAAPPPGPASAPGVQAPGVQAPGVQAPPQPTPGAPPPHSPTMPPKFIGVVEDHTTLVGPVEVEAATATRKVKCPIRPETGAFDCGYVGEVIAVRLVVNARTHASTWDGAQTDTHITPGP